MSVSNDSVSAAMFKLGKYMHRKLKTAPPQLKLLKNLRNRFPKFDKMDEVLFNLYYCYNKNGETVKAEQIKKLMSTKYPKKQFHHHSSNG